jgi:hypothetical protein
MKNGYSRRNHSKDGIIERVIIPYVNGQIITSSNRIINLRSAKTKEIISANKFNKLVETPEFEENNCTSEFVDLIKQKSSVQPSRSLLQKKYSIVKDQVFTL